MAAGFHVEIAIWWWLIERYRDERRGEQHMTLPKGLLGQDLCRDRDKCIGSSFLFFFPMIPPGRVVRCGRECVYIGRLREI